MLYIDLNNFSLTKKSEILKEDIIAYWSQPDFAYKRRVHIYDSNNDEIGYVQYKILTCQSGIEYFDKTDKQIDVSDIVVENKESEYNYELVSNGNVVAKVFKDNNRLNIDIMNDSMINKCLLLVYGLIDKGE